MAVKMMRMTSVVSRVATGDDDIEYEWPWFKDPNGGKEDEYQHYRAMVKYRLIINILNRTTAINDPIDLC